MTVPVHRPARGQHPRVPRSRRPLGLHLTDQHRRLPVVGGRRPRAGDHLGRARPAAGSVRTLQTLAQMEHHEPSGMYYNWYDEATGKPVRIWPDNGNTVLPFVSSVDNGWLGAALWVVRNAVPDVAALAGQLFDRMRWKAFYNSGTRGRAPAPSAQGGLMHGGFYPFEHDRPGGVYRGTHIGGADVWLTTHHYDTIVSETRITSYLGIMTEAGAAAALLRGLAHLPRDLRLELARDAARGRGARVPRDQGLRGCLHLSRHARSSRAGVARCSRSSCRTSSCPRRTGARAAGDSTTRSTCGPSVSTASSTPSTATGASRRRATRRAATGSTASTRSA